MKKKERYEKVQLLKAGQIVEIAGDFFQAIRIPDDWCIVACLKCSLDSLCKGDIAEVCSELDEPLSNKYYLKLANRRKKEE